MHALPRATASSSFQSVRLAKKREGGEVQKPTELVKTFRANGLQPRHVGKKRVDFSTTIRVSLLDLNANSVPIHALMWKLIFVSEPCVNDKETVPQLPVLAIVSRIDGSTKKSVLYSPPRHTHTHKSHVRSEHIEYIQDNPANKEATNNLWGVNRWHAKLMQDNRMVEIKVGQLLGTSHANLSVPSKVQYHFRVKTSIGRIRNALIVVIRLETNTRNGV